ncbi:MAG: hypothetical protein WA191_02015, partial [Telluria sp.]
MITTGQASASTQICIIIAYGFSGRQYNAQVRPAGAQNSSQSPSAVAIAGAAIFLGAAAATGGRAAGVKRG